ncbi:MAG: helix-turn-helix domain-containing protein [Bradymonadaceae bacterium]|nr:helix-turn-helix domain-containing protein [Lujinxingiaceae bacterium]
MRHPAPRIELPLQVREMLEGWTRQYTLAAHFVLRAKILLAASQGIALGQIARDLGIERNTVKKWRRRWLEAAQRLSLVADQDPASLEDQMRTLLSDASRPGTPPTFEPEQIVRIVRLACSEPQEHGVEVSHWTPELLAKTAVQEGIVASISPASVRRFLKTSRSQASSLPRVGGAAA